MEEIQSHTHVRPSYQVLFSTLSRHFISPHSSLSPEEFASLLEEAGGNKGYAKLYLLPINHVESDNLNPDYNCLAGLGELTVDQCIALMYCTFVAMYHVCMCV